MVDQCRAAKVKGEHENITKMIAVVVVRACLLGIKTGLVHEMEDGQGPLQEVLLFMDELGKIHVASDGKPCFCKPRSVPFSVKKMEEQELERLLEEKIIEPVKFSDWTHQF